ncbi:GNAT family N-acetyltransferase [Flavivirga spongiicola]|uniref:GNAT family N-acetyltransferase n=1 Tax=Flavivirga spongiicola TaxID=421621 RepID=A0ABU7XR19_9FLAO|nr:GNAT family N-acetyltransferase [Flavivirga sp. MEBiC05379]MDO5977282.1 GNAT family N-acetyltransferase [Flavivirga sp. MEBiC05379]
MITTIIQASLEHLDDLAPLSDEYRVFYRQPSDPNSVKDFLKERLTKQDSIIYIAYINGVPVGFTQLYILFSSVSMRPMYILNDLYINPNYQNKSVGTTLIDKVKALCKEKGHKGVLYLYKQKSPTLHNIYTNAKAL